MRPVADDRPITTDVRYLEVGRIWVSFSLCSLLVEVLSFACPQARTTLHPGHDRGPTVIPADADITRTAPRPLHNGHPARTLRACQPPKPCWKDWIPSAEDENHSSNTGQCPETDQPAARTRSWWFLPCWWVSCSLCSSRRFGDHANVILTRLKPHWYGGEGYTGTRCVVCGSG